MEHISKFYLINLKKRTERLDHFLKEYDREGLPMEKLTIFPAIDGKSHDFTQKEMDMFKGNNFFDLKSIMGNQLSHYYILLDIIKNEYKTCIIFQDDVKLKKNFKNDLGKVIENLPPDFEIIWIGIHLDAYGHIFREFPIDGGYDKNFYLDSTVNDFICVLKPEINPCSLAYIITLEGAKKIVTDFLAKGFKQAADINYNEYLRQKGIMYSSSTILCTGCNIFKSDVFLNDDFYLADKVITKKIEEKCKGKTKILEIISSEENTRFGPANIFLNIKDIENGSTLYLENKFFDFVYCRNSMSRRTENPSKILEEIFRLGRYGHLENPAPLIELSWDIEKPEFRGFTDSTMIYWTGDDEKFYAVEKKPIVHSMVTLPRKYTENNFSFNWSSYYDWNEGDIIFFTYFSDFDKYSYEEILLKSIGEGARHCLKYWNETTLKND